MENTPKPRKVIRISRNKLIISVIVLVIIATVVVVGSNRRQMFMGVGSYGAMETNSISSADVPTVDFGDDYGARYPSPYPNNSPDITDTREFLKVSYSAQIKARNIADKVKDVKNAVRDAEGRVDNFSSSEKYGYVSFVVSKDKFDQFKEEVEALTHKKLYTENISSQNLLGQKQVIEKNFVSTSETLAQLEQQKKTLDTGHNSAVNGKGGYKEQLATLATQISKIRQQIAATENSNEKAQLQAQESLLMSQQARTTQALASENNTYASLSASLVSRIANAKSNVNTVVDQDITFGNNIETVSGSVNVNWVSIWEIMKIYSPIHPTIIVIVLALALLYLLNRMSWFPKVEII